MEMKTIFKNEFERKNLVWESIKDLKKNLTSTYSTNSSTFNTARSQKPIPSDQQFLSNEDLVANDYQEYQSQEGSNQFRFSCNQKDNNYVSNHSQEEGAFSKIDTNLQEIPRINEQSFSSLNSEKDASNNDFNEFRRIPPEITKQNESQEDNSNDFRKRSISIRNEISAKLNELSFNPNKSIENNNCQSFRKNDNLNTQESCRKDGILPFNLPKSGQKTEVQIQNQQNSFRKQRAPSSDQFLRSSNDCDEYKKKSTQFCNTISNQNELAKQLSQENEDLKNLISKIRKENNQRVQKMQREFDQQLKDVNKANEEMVNDLKIKFQEELASKEEDIQTMILVYQEEQSKNQQNESEQKQIQVNEENTKAINILQAQLEECIKEKNILIEENSNLQQQFEHLKSQNLQNLKDKQNELHTVGEKYEREIQSLRKEMNDKVLQTNQENLKKIDIFVKENIRLEDQVQRLEKLSKENQQQLSLKDIQLESLKNELKQTKDLLEQELKKQQALAVKEESKPVITQINVQKPQIQVNEKNKLLPLDEINAQSYQTLVKNRDENDKENIRIHSIITPQVPSKNIYEQDKALKNLLAKINDFIEQKDTKDTPTLNNKDNNTNLSTNLNTSQQSLNQKSSLNNHYNKKLRILRTSNNTNLNTSQIQYADSQRRGQSLVNQSLNESYSSASNYQQQAHQRNYSIERDTNIRNPYFFENVDSNRSQFFPHSKSNSNLNTQRRAVSTHLNSSQVAQQRQIERDNNLYNNYNHNRSFFSESDTSKGNLDFLSINQHIGNPHLNSRESPLKIEEEFNSIQQKRQQQLLQSQINQDLSMISKAPYNENYSSCLNEYSYMSSKLQDKIEIRLNNQQQVFKLQEKENHPLLANNHYKYSNQIDQDGPSTQKQSRKQFQSTQEIQQKLSLWDNMDQLAVEDEDQNGFMSTIKDLHSKIRLIKK